MQYDFAIYDKSERLVALFEAKAHHGTSASWAAKFRRNLFVHYGKPDVEFFGIVTPGVLYLWRESQDLPVHCPPTFQIDLGPYFGDIPEQTLRGYAFEFAVSSWLMDLMDGVGSEWPGFEETGFVETIQRGRLQIEAAA
jgi:hypothetical protein